MERIEYIRQQIENTMSQLEENQIHQDQEILIYKEKKTLIKAKIHKIHQLKKYFIEINSASHPCIYKVNEKILKLYKEKETLKDEKENMLYIRHKCQQLSFLHLADLQSQIDYQYDTINNNVL